MTIKENQKMTSLKYHLDLLLKYKVLYYVEIEALLVDILYTGYKKKQISTIVKPKASLFHSESKIIIVFYYFVFLYTLLLQIL